MTFGVSFQNKIATMNSAPLPQRKRQLPIRFRESDQVKMNSVYSYIRLFMYIATCIYFFMHSIVIINIAI